jgi:predicted neuraminidase
MSMMMASKLTLQRSLILLIILISFVAAFYKAVHFPAPSKFQKSATNIVASSTPRFESHFASSKLFTQVHASSSIELKDGRIRAFWFSGSREGAKDVAIHTAVFDPTKSQWSTEEVLITRERTQSALHRYVSKLGNPVVGRETDGTLRMFYVTVSLGGWAGSSITTMTSTDEGATWSEPSRLVTSPFINISTLVKGTPFAYGDGTMGMPIYHEFISKFGEILKIDNNGTVLDLQRLAAGGQGTLQPVVLIEDANKARVLMRYAGLAEPRRVVTVTTEDGGNHWTKPEKTTLRNPDAAVTGVVLPDGRDLVVLNDLEQGRQALSLMISADGGKSWREVQRLEDQLGENIKFDEAHFIINTQTLVKQSDSGVKQHLAEYVESAKHTACTNGQCGYEFSYPYLIQTQHGDFHLVYTWNRTFVKHLWFNQAWLDQRTLKSSHDALN